MSAMVEVFLCFKTKAKTPKGNFDPTFTTLISYSHLSSSHFCMEEGCKRTHEAKSLIKLVVALTLPLAGFIIANLTAPNRKSTRRRTTTHTSSPTSQEEEDMTRSPMCTSHSVFSDDDEERPRRPESAPEESESSRSMPSAGGVESPRVQQPEFSDVVSIFHHQEGPRLGEEIEGLKHVVAYVEVGQREMESQFRQYVNARDQESWYQSLQIMYLGFKLESMEAQNKRIESTIANYQTTVEKLNKIRSEMRQLRKKVKKLSRRSRQHSTAIRGHDLALHDGETTLWRTNEELKQVRQEIKELGDRIQEDRRAEGRLPQMQTAATHPPTSKGEEEVMQGDKVSMKRFRDREFMDQQLQLFHHRWYAEMEELIYLGWLGANLRHEMLMTNGEEEADSDAEERERTKLMPVQEVKDKLIMELPGHCGAKDCKVELHGSGGSSSVAELTVADQMEVVATLPHTAAAPKKPRLLRKIEGWAKGKRKGKSSCYNKDYSSNIC